MFTSQNVPCVPCSLLAEGFEGESGHAHLEPIAVFSGPEGNATASRLRCRECAVVWLHDAGEGWRIHDPDNLLEGFIPTDRDVRARIARA